MRLVGAETFRVCQQLLDGVQCLADICAVTCCFVHSCFRICRLSFVWPPESVCNLCYSVQRHFALHCVLLEGFHFAFSAQ